MICQIKLQLIRIFIHANTNTSPITSSQERHHWNQESHSNILINQVQGGIISSQRYKKNIKHLAKCLPISGRLEKLIWRENCGQNVWRDFPAFSRGFIWPFRFIPRFFSYRPDFTIQWNNRHRFLSLSALSNIRCNFTAVNKAKCQQRPEISRDVAENVKILKGNPLSVELEVFRREAPHL